MTPRRDVDAFLDVLDDTPPNAVTACAGWTAHKLVAHLTSGVEAIASQVEAHLENRPIPVFGSFAAREMEFWPIDDHALRRRLVSGERRMTDGLAEVAAADPDRAIPDVGWGMPLRDLILHMRQEFVVHRWDLVGDDDEGNGLLANPELIDHCVRILAEPLLAAGRRRDPHPDEPFSTRIRTPGQRDLIVTVNRLESTLQLVDSDDTDAAIECDAAARLLLLWGRRPAAASRVKTSLDAATLTRLTAILAGF